jgi:hypothetical protein
MNSIFKLAIAAFSFTLLAACGGGGAAFNTAEGIWQGPSSTGANVTVAILENGESWGGSTVGNTWVSALAGTANGQARTRRFQPMGPSLISQPTR